MIADLYNWRAVLFEVVGFFALAAMWILVGRAWSALPASIPCHFDLLGRPDSWGSKHVLWILPALATLIFAGLSIVLLVFEARPIDLEFGAAMNALVAVTNLFLCQRMIAVGVGRRKTLGKWFCPAILGSLAILIAIYSGKIS